MFRRDPYLNRLHRPVVCPSPTLYGGVSSACSEVYPQHAEVQLKHFEANLSEPDSPCGAVPDDEGCSSSPYWLALRENVGWGAKSLEMGVRPRWNR